MSSLPPDYIARKMSEYFSDMSWLRNSATLQDYQIKYPRPENKKEFTGDIEFEVELE